MSLPELRDLYRSMLRVRRIEEAIVERYGAQEMRCPVHLSIGQEAIATGVCEALRRDDTVFSGHRAHAHYLAKGGSLPGMIAEIYGRATGCSAGVGGSMHIIDLEAGFHGAVPIVGATVPLAVGAAWAARLRGEDRVVVVFLGDGTFEEGVVHESLNFAVLHRLPVLFVCENNLYACYSRLSERQPDRPIHAVAAAHGCQAYAIDGNDVRAVYQTAQSAVASLRAGGTPVFMECATYRWLEHCGHLQDDGLGYRPTGELARWEATCPLRRLEAELACDTSFAAYAARAKAEIASEIDAAFTAALSAPLPQPADLPGYLLA
jgi:TPP-dependent pyruvate/acetoin dehydrogenase alpha subunit